MLSPRKPNSTISGTTVEFREILSSGTVVVRVMLSLPTPRIMLFAETADGTVPVSIFLDDLLGYVAQASQLLQLEGNIPSESVTHASA